jgi:hypothetical protein
MLKNRVYPVIFLNSLFFFLCAYLTLFFLSSISVAISASAFSIPVRLYYNEIDFLIRSTDWSADAVTVIYCTGPLLFFILGFILMIIFINVSTESGILRIFLVWMVILSIVLFLGEIIIGALLNQGFGYVIMYLFIMDTGKIVLTIFGGIVLFTAGLMMSRILLFPANTYLSDLKGLEKTRFILYQYIFPYLAGILILQLVEIPRISWYNTLVRLSGIIFLIPVLSRSAGIQDIYFEEEKPELYISWKTAAFALGFLIIYRVAFGIGIRFLS